MDGGISRGATTGACGTGRGVVAGRGEARFAVGVGVDAGGGGGGGGGGGATTVTKVKISLGTDGRRPAAKSNGRRTTAPIRSACTVHDTTSGAMSRRVVFRWPLTIRSNMTLSSWIPHT
jgi:hypothetical protein